VEALAQFVIAQVLPHANWADIFQFSGDNCAELVRRVKACAAAHPAPREPASKLEADALNELARVRGLVREALGWSMSAPAKDLLRRCL
jgi:hypothetical protein